MPKASGKLKLGKGSAFVKSQLKRLAQEDETWEADYRALPKPMGQSATHYFGQVVEQDHGALLADLYVERTPDANDLAKLLADAMRRPLFDSPRRPRRVLFRKNPRWKELFPHLTDIGVEVAVQNSLPLIEEACGDYIRQMHETDSAGRPTPTPEQAAIEEAFPVVAQWINDGHGHIEIGDQEGFGFIARALDYGGLVFEDETPRSLVEALVALERALPEFLREAGCEVRRHGRITKSVPPST